MAYTAELGSLRRILSNGEGLFSEREQTDLDGYIRTLQFGTMYWSLAGDGNETVRRRAESDCALAVSRARFLLERNPGLEWLSVSPQARPRREIERRFPYGSGTLLLRISRQESAAPHFLIKEYDLVRASDPVLDVGDAPVTYAALLFHGASGAYRLPIRILAAGKEIGVVDLKGKDSTGGPTRGRDHRRGRRAAYSGRGRALHARRSCLGSGRSAPFRW